MPRTRPLSRTVLGAALTTVLVSGCTDGGGDASPLSGKRNTSPDRGVTLSARLDTPTDVTLRWNGRDPEAAGQIVEFATEPRGAYTILEFAPGGQSLFKHPDLMPRTPFYYRLRAYGGPVSPAVDIALPKGTLGRKDQNRSHEWAVPRKLSKAGSAAERHRVRGENTDRAAPTRLRATVKHANGVLLTWRDQARDEDGYLVEVRPEGAADFRVAAVLDPDIESTGLITLPQEKRASIRVRAFFYGDRSNVVHRTTGEQSAG
ncbi:fibronectin type III domain-containing protein [Streptomyces sp. NPDC000594]|uniref:fibronectin type III domain-containing protein n=1 Tax=Streptomyces sp. NPDC000594 TaxID=3154261 RepID=UPI00331D561A